MDNAAQVALSKVPDSVWAPITNWPFVSCCLAIAIMMVTIKRIVKQSSPLRFAMGKTQAMFTAGYVVLGAIVAIPKGFLHGDVYFQRAIVGVIAGGVCLMLYHALLKRLAIVMGVKESDVVDADDDKGLRVSQDPPAPSPGNQS